jgi:hypothetical protein
MIFAIRNCEGKRELLPRRNSANIFLFAEGIKENKGRRSAKKKGKNLRNGF